MKSLMVVLNCLLALVLTGCSSWNNLNAAELKVVYGLDYEPQRWGESEAEYKARTGYKNPWEMQKSQIPPEQVFPLRVK